VGGRGTEETVKISSSRFVRAVVRAQDGPKDTGPDVVFLGRSNVGKSTLINRLLGTKGLARTSSQPGRTQAVHLYRVNDAFYFVDLPGYGYAKVPERVRQAWGPLVEGYLESRRAHVALALLVIDARHEPTQLDRVMWDWLVQRDLPHVVVATKTDKLSGNGRAKARTHLKRTFGESEDTPTLLASPVSGLGIRELWSHLDRALRATGGSRNTSGADSGQTRTGDHDRRAAGS
jgi:GTP-binding protein